MSLGSRIPPGDPFRFTTIAHARRRILGPIDVPELDAFLDRLPLPAAPSVLDIGCGKGDLLVRLALRGGSGVGVDRNPWFLAEAERGAAEASVGDRVELRLADAAGERLPAGRTIVACVGATGAVGGPQAAPAVLAGLAAPGGVVVIGEGYWRVPPADSWLEAFGIERGEMVDLEATIARMREPGLEVVSVHEASIEAWDAYEDDYAAAVESWAAANPGDPDCEAFLARATFMRETYAAWRRRAMGFALVALRR